MLKFFYNFISKLQNFFFIWIRRTINSVPVFETFLGLGLIFIRVLFNEITEKEYYFKFDAPVYDTGSMMSFLIFLEHIYVCYYLIIIITMVYWFLYLCIIDFSGWSLKNKGIFYVVYNLIFLKLWNKYINIFFLNIYKFIYYIFTLYKEIDYLYFNLYRIINFNLNESSSNFLYKYFFFKNTNLVLLNNLNNTYDLLGRSYLIFNNESIKYWKFINIIFEFISLLGKDMSFLEELYLRKNFNKYLYYTRPKLYDFFFYSNIVYFIHNKKASNLSLNYMIINLRSLYKDIFLTNQFKHSGLFEVIWAIFPTFVIICILIPSLILLYSFEDILSPKLSVKVIGNQWYWTYEFDNWLQYKQLKNIQNSSAINQYIFNNNKSNLLNIKKNLVDYSKMIFTIDRNYWKLMYLTRDTMKDGIAYTILQCNEWDLYYKYYQLNNPIMKVKKPSKWDEYYINELENINNNYSLYFNNNNNNDLVISKNIYTNYSYNSVIIPQDNLIYGTKRLLEVDNRLVLPTNITIRFLITSADVLHSFAMPELGFKVDAVPGRLNQILVFINRPGIFYGQCSELCGANHAFMPIVIQSVLPETYLSYIENIQLKTDLINSPN